MHTSSNNFFWRHIGAVDRVAFGVRHFSTKGKGRQYAIKAPRLHVLVLFDAVDGFGADVRGAGKLFLLRPSEALAMRADTIPLRHRAVILPETDRSGNR